MDEKQLSIEQVMEIMGWSYPTARNFAVKYGELVGNKWHVPSTAVDAKIATLSANARYVRARYEVAVMEPAT